MDDWRGGYFWGFIAVGRGTCSASFCLLPSLSEGQYAVLGGSGMGGACNADRAVAVQLLGSVVCGVFYIKDVRVD